MTGQIFFSTRFRKIQGIKKGHHFRITAAEPGVVYMEASDGQEKKHTLLKPGVQIVQDELPTVIQPEGLSAQRQWYLHDKIWEFCPATDKDVTCPLPSAPRLVSKQGTPEPPSSPNPSPSPSSLPSPKRPRKERKCGVCHQPGHNRATCPQVYFYTFNRFF